VVLPCLRVLKGHTEDVLCAAVGMDGKLASGGKDIYVQMCTYIHNTRNYMYIDINGEGSLSGPAGSWKGIGLLGRRGIHQDMHN